MKAIKAVGAMLSVMVTIAIFAALNGCFGTTTSLKTGNMEIQSIGAGLIKVEAGKTTFKIKCKVCGYEEERTADTPVIGAPYMLDWICPKCGHRQKITIRAAG